MISRPQPGTGWQSLGGSGSGVTDQAIMGSGGSRVVRKSGPVIRSPALREVSVIEWSVTGSRRPSGGAVSWGGMRRLNQCRVRKSLAYEGQSWPGDHSLAVKVRPRPLWVKGGKAAGGHGQPQRGPPKGSTAGQGPQSVRGPGPPRGSQPGALCPVVQPLRPLPLYIRQPQLPRTLFSLQQGLEHSEGLSPPWKG